MTTPPTESCARALVGLGQPRWLWSRLRPYKQPVFRSLKVAISKFVLSGSIASALSLSFIHVNAHASQPNESADGAELIKEDLTVKAELDDHSHTGALGSTGSGTPGCTSKIHDVPLARNKMFSSRDKDLDFLMSVLEDASASQRSCVIHGIGGVGKTQLALEFTYRYQSRFKYVFWCSAGTSETLRITYGRIAELLALETTTESASQRNIEMTRRWLCENKDWLLVFDNTEVENDTLTQFWPPCAHGAVILTSQRKDISFQTRTHLRLLPFNDTEGAELLLRNIGRDDQVGSVDMTRLAREISAQVDGLPLWLVGLVGFVSQSHSELAHVLKVLEESREPAAQMLSDGATKAATFQYHDPIQHVFQRALDCLPELARRVIYVMSMLSPEEIPESMFLQGPLPGLPLVALEPHRTIMFAQDVRQHLCSRHLTDIRTRGSDTSRVYSIHRSVQRSILNALDNDRNARESIFNTAVALVDTQLPRPSPIMVPKYELWEVFRVYIPHVLALHKVYKTSRTPIRPTVQFAELIRSAAAYFYENNLTSECLEIATTGEEVCHQLTDLESAAQATTENTHSLDPPKPCHPATLTRLEADILAYGAGVIWNTRGIADRKAGHDKTWRVVELRQKHASNTRATTDEDQLLLANSYNDFALQLINECDYSNARTYIAKSLKIKGKHLDEDTDQYEFYSSKMLLAEISLAEGNTAEALKLAEEAIEHMERERGPEDMLTVHCKFYLAIMHMNLKNYQKALPLLETVLEGRKHRFGETQITTLDCYFALALCQFRLGQTQKARHTLTHCLGQDKTAHWCRESSLRAEYLNAILLNRLGDQGEGTAHMAEAIKERNSMLSKYGEGRWATAQACDDQLVHFDYLVNYSAGTADSLTPNKLLEWLDAYMRNVMVRAKILNSGPPNCLGLQKYTTETSLTQTRLCVDIPLDLRIAAPINNSARLNSANPERHKSHSFHRHHVLISGNSASLNRQLIAPTSELGQRAWSPALHYPL
ncbi:hypothetical protein OQA88_8948 [Cercophora sp. LCS_1]